MHKYPLINDSLNSIGLTFRNGKHFLTTFLPIFTVYFLIELWDTFDADSRSGPGLLFLIAGLVTWASFATTWHRLIMLNEHVSLVNSFKLGARERSFIWRGILLGAISLLYTIPLIALVFSFGSGLTDNIFALISFVLVTMFFAALWNRLSLVLPAAALDMKGFGFKQAWHSTRNTWIQFAIGSVTCIVPFTVLSMATIIFSNAELTLGGVALVALGVIFQVASISAFACYLSLVFKRLVLEPMLDEEANALAGAED